MKRSGPLKRKTELRADPEKTRAWQDRSRKPLARKTALKSGKPLQSKTPIGRHVALTGAATPRPRRKPDPPELVEAKAERRLISNDVCELDGCGHRAVHFHHRWRRRHRGAHACWNLLHLCSSCHGAIHANVEASYRKGYLLRDVDGQREHDRRMAELAAMIAEAAG